MKQPDGSWSGISVDLWRSIARDLGLPFALREYDLQGLLDGVRTGQVDIGAAALTITPERESVLDFTHPFHVSGLGIAVPREGRAGLLGALAPLVSAEFLVIIGGLLVLLLVVGTLVWFFERRRNADQFSSRPVEGIASGIWWSAVTMTTVGYGDLAPRSLGGRLVGVLWMFAAVVLVSSFTATIASSLTLGQLRGPVQGPDDLGDVRVGTVQGSTSAEYLAWRRIDAWEYPSDVEALRDLAHGELDAVVYDAPILRYRVERGFRGSVRVLPVVFERQYYGFALPGGSPLREALNRDLLQRIETPEWQSVLTRYLGSAP